LVLSYRIRCRSLSRRSSEGKSERAAQEKLAIEIPLKISAVREGVQVNASADVLRTTDASVGEVVEPKSVQELPLNGRMLVDLVLTVPGRT